MDVLLIPTNCRHNLASLDLNPVLHPLLGWVAGVLTLTQESRHDNVRWLGFSIFT